MRASGVDPYPARTPARVPVADVRERFGDLEAGAETAARLAVAGRIAARRGHGKAMFLDLADRTGRLQLHASLDSLARSAYAALADTDLGDVIAADGDVFVSRRGELSLRVREWHMLAKCLRPLPEKWHGLTDIELRHRQVRRPDRERGLRRARDGPVPDGDGDARRARRATASSRSRPRSSSRSTAARRPSPSRTYYNEFERDFYLRIADELYLKRLIVGGLERVYEIAKDFRNEGVSFKHNPEFTMLEWYEAYGDYEVGMASRRARHRRGRGGGGQRDRPHAALAPRLAARGDPRARRHRSDGGPRSRPAGRPPARGRHRHRRPTRPGRTRSTTCSPISSSRPSSARRSSSTTRSSSRRLPSARRAIPGWSSGSRRSASAWSSGTATPS